MLSGLKTAVTVAMIVPSGLKTGATVEKICRRNVHCNATRHSSSVVHTVEDDFIKKRLRLLENESGL